MPGLGKGNFIFYKYLGLDEIIADKLEIDDERFINALKEHEKNNYDKALKIYEDILISNENISMSQEYPVLVANNIAVAKAQKKLFDEAEYILKLLLNEKTSRKEIIYFNLSKIYQLKNKKKLFLEYKKMSYEQDESMYRIREKYKNKLEEINKENKEIIFINMEKILSQNYFLDHCHLLPKGQRILAEEILKNIKNKNFIGKYKAIIENSMYNPELYRGNYRKFHYYFKTFADLNKDEISELFEEIFSQQEHDIKTKKLINLYHQNYLIELAIKFYAKHPIYEVLEDLKINTPKVPSDIGRFPEYFLVRTIIPYVEQIEKNKTYKSYFSHEIFRSSEELKKILPEDAKEYIDDYPNELNRKKGQDRFNRIIEKCREMLLNHLKQGSQINERKKATIFWYFRETLRFGSHSRISMMYDRITLEHLGEALMVAFLIEKK